MVAAFCALFLLFAVVIVRSALAAIDRRTPRWVRIIYFSSLVGSAIAAYYTTFHYVYFTDPNTRLHGWPIPTIIFQRDDAQSPWLDFVGPTIIFAFPMNLVLFLLLPSVVSLIFAWRFRKPTL